MENPNLETIQFRQCRRFDGAVEPVAVIRHNRRREMQFPPSVIEFPLYTEAEESVEYRELLDEVCQNLSEVERRTWLKIIDGRSILDIATEEGVTRQAIYSRIGAMVRKNSYCAIWWRLKHKKNQYE
jgi:hypothetical protein